MPQTYLRTETKRKAAPVAWLVSTCIHLVCSFANLREATGFGWTNSCLPLSFCTPSIFENVTCLSRMDFTLIPSPTMFICVGVLLALVSVLQPSNSKHLGHGTQWDHGKCALHSVVFTHEVSCHAVFLSCAPHHKICVTFYHLCVRVSFADHPSRGRPKPSVPYLLMPTM